MSFEKIRIGDVVNVAGLEWIVLDKLDDVVFCLTKDMLSDKREFGYGNNYAESYIRSYLNIDVLDALAFYVGEDAFYPMNIDLTTLAGERDYGSVKDKIGLLNLDMYRAYSGIIECYKVHGPWYLSTGWTTAQKDNGSTVLHVSSNGEVYGAWYDESWCVRPCCVFKSSVFEGGQCK